MLRSIYLEEKFIIRIQSLVNTPWNPALLYQAYVISLLHQFIHLSISKDLFYILNGIMITLLHHILIAYFDGKSCQNIEDNDRDCEAENEEDNVCKKVNTTPLTPEQFIVGVCCIRLWGGKHVQTHFTHQHRHNLVHSDQHVVEVRLILQNQSERKIETEYDARVRHHQFGQPFPHLNENKGVRSYVGIYTDHSEEIDPNEESWHSSNLKAKRQWLMMNQALDVTFLYQ